MHRAQGRLRRLAPPRGRGRSFVTTGPLLLLDVDGRASGRGSSARTARVRIACGPRARSSREVAPIQTVQIIVNGRVVHEQSVAGRQDAGDLDRARARPRPESSSWIAARAFSKATSGAPDAEAHTNPVYVYLDGKAPYDRDSLDRLVGRIDEQMAVHRARTFAEKARVLDYFQKSRDILLRIRREGGLPAGGVPDAWIDDDAAAIDASRRTIPRPGARTLPPAPAGGRLRTRP